MPRSGDLISLPLWARWRGASLAGAVTDEVSRPQRYLNPARSGTRKRLPCAKGAGAKRLRNCPFNAVKRRQEKSLPLWAREACAAVVNDMPVACQSRAVTEPQ